jgi:putative IMPACT (imprinted ancient) family translation regulator
MAKKQPKALRFINTLKKGYNSLLGKELASAINKKAVGAVGMVPVPSMKKGGVVKKTGLIRAHKGEVVLTTAQRAQLKRLLK